METTTTIIETTTTAATTAFQAASVMAESAANVENQIMQTVMVVLPLGLVIVGTVIAITFGIKFLRKVTKG